MRSTAYTNQGRFELRSPTSTQEWDRYHSIRERAIWDGLDLKAMGVAAYSRDEDGASNGNRAAPPFPLVTMRNGIVCGTLGLEPTSVSVIEIRAVAVEPACQRRGYGSIMMALAEKAAAKEGYQRAVILAHAHATPFYAANGYRSETADAVGGLSTGASPVPHAVWMGKRLDLGVAQNPPTVFIAAA